MISWICLPSTPPALLISSSAIFAPWATYLPDAANAPVSGCVTPILIVSCAAAPVTMPPATIVAVTNSPASFLMSAPPIRVDASMTYFGHAFRTTRTRRGAWDVDSFARRSLRFPGHARDVLGDQRAQARQAFGPRT